MAADESDTIPHLGEPSKEIEQKATFPPGFDELAIERTGLPLLELGRELGDDFSPRLTLRRLPQELHQEIGFRIKEVLPVDEEYKKELFAIVVGDKLPPGTASAIDQWFAENPEISEDMEDNELLQGLPSLYKKAFTALPAFTGERNIFVKAMGIRTVLNDLSDVAYVRFLEREMKRRNPSFDPATLGDTPQGLHSSTNDFGQSDKDLRILHDEAVRDNLKYNPMTPEEFKNLMLPSAPPDSAEFIDDPEMQVVLRYLSMGSISQLDAYKNIMTYGNQLEQQLLATNPELAAQLDAQQNSFIESKGFELLGLPSSEPIPALIWQQVQRALPQGAFIPKGILLEYIDTEKWRYIIDDVIVPTEKQQDFQAFYGGERLGDTRYLANGETQKVDVLTLYRRMLRDLPPGLTPEQTTKEVVARYARVGIHELFEAWILQQPTEKVKALIDKVHQDPITVNDKEGVYPRSEAIKKAYDNTSGLLFQPEQHHWLIEQVVESVAAYILKPDELRQKHPNAYEAVETMIPLPKQSEQ